jgi:hypothetical protein
MMIHEKMPLKSFIVLPNRWNKPLFNLKWYCISNSIYCAERSALYMDNNSGGIHRISEISSILLTIVHIPIHGLHNDPSRLHESCREIHKESVESAWNLPNEWNPQGIGGGV